ncbi:unnamed protein product [Caenorhabditis auriculariae]|uniref:PDZ domain-containing protein n=1 Tax=Caenorhabditis auriculariae TaxID=2777116 RepID=A0A8S1GP93_9PELO|nr:unnamed protein product [Caenorhabditis auriculariae]
MVRNAGKSGRYSHSAYENLCMLTCDEDEHVFGAEGPSGDSITNPIADSDDRNDYIFHEVTLKKEDSLGNGLGFGIVGNRTSGVFVAYVHPSSTQAQKLLPGDRLMACEKCSLRAVTADQAACILRYHMQQHGYLRIAVERKRNGEKLMSVRRMQGRYADRVGQHGDENCPTSAQELTNPHWNQSSRCLDKVLLKMTSSSYTYTSSPMVSSTRLYGYSHYLALPTLFYEF